MCRFGSGMERKTAHFQFAWRKKLPTEYLIATRVTLMALDITHCLSGISAKSFRI